MLDLLDIGLKIKPTSRSETWLSSDCVVPLPSVPRSVSNMPRLVVIQLLTAELERSFVGRGAGGQWGHRT